MHRPSARIMRAAIVGHIVGMLGATEHIKNIFKPNARNYRRRSAPYPRQNEREKLRRQLGGFARLHDHQIILLEPGERRPGKQYDFGRKVRQCPICDLGKSHAEVARAA